jgi:siderophore synthetase component
MLSFVRCRFTLGFHQANVKPLSVNTRPFMNDSGGRFAQARSRLSSRHGAGRRIYENRRDSTGNEWKTTTKQAYLSLCTREQYAATRSAPRDAVAHLTPEVWEEANRLLVRKALAEFTHERLVTPERLPDGPVPRTVRRRRGRVPVPGAPAAPRPLAHRRRGHHSVTGRASLPLDALDLALEVRHTLGLDEQILPVYLEEISSTLASSAFKLSAPPVEAGDLADAAFQAIETGMTEGHPCFVANNGRLGFDAADYRAYAPEAGRPVRLLWLAARRHRATFTSGAGLDYETLIAAELDEATVARFGQVLAGLGLDLADHFLIPVHPWQWWNRLAVTYAAEVARRQLVCLGTATTSTWRSSRSGRSSTSPRLPGTTSRPRCRC